MFFSLSIPSPFSTHNMAAAFLRLRRHRLPPPTYAANRLAAPSPGRGLHPPKLGRRRVGPSLCLRSAANWLGAPSPDRGLPTLAPRRLQVGRAPAYSHLADVPSRTMHDDAHRRFVAKPRSRAGRRRGDHTVAASTESSCTSSSA